MSIHGYSRFPCHNCGKTTLAFTKSCKDWAICDSCLWEGRLKDNMDILRQRGDLDWGT